jgi:inner membrane protein
LDNDTLHTFELRLTLDGSGELAFTPLSQNTVINVNADWSSPGFFGDYLPASHTIGDDRFAAVWEINDFFPDLGHGARERLSSQWLEGSGSGVRFVQPVDTYQLVTRAAKYAVLFIGLTFLVYFLAELFGRVALHPVQYLFVGMANCIFYLLLLSLAEHIHFGLAYAVSATAATCMIASYSLSILRSRARAVLVLAALAGLYTCLFVTLRSEAYALLIGSVGLFLSLGLLMYLTRNIDWQRPAGEPV